MKYGEETLQNISKKLKELIISIVVRFYKFFLKRRLAKTKKVSFGKKSSFSRNSIFEGNNLLSTNSALINSKIGFASYLGENSTISNAKIGRYTSIGPDVKCVLGNHPTNTFVSTHPVFFSTRKQIGFSFTEKQLFPEFSAPLNQKEPYTINIGNDVWIGANVRILDGVRIGDGAIIATGATVVKDIPAYAVVGGTPARIIKYRFSDNQIDQLLKIKWWNKDFEWIKTNSQSFFDIAQFIAKNKI